MRCVQRTEKFVLGTPGAGEFVPQLKSMSPSLRT